MVQAQEVHVPVERVQLRLLQMCALREILVRRGETKILKIDGQISHVHLVRLKAVHLLVYADLLKGQIIINVAARVHRLEQVQQLPADEVDVRRFDAHLLVANVPPQFQPIRFKYAKPVDVPSTNVFF